MKKKYQVFVSSTHDDLVEERKAVSQALLESGCIPAGMELFPASNKSSWEIIKSVIDECDYYLLIVAGRYGSQGRDDDGKLCGYTEMEYNYASKAGIPTIVFIHSDIDNLPASKVEESKRGKQRRKKFVDRLKQDNRNVKFWNNTGSLISAIKTSILALIEDCPRTGWIKTDRVEDDQLLLSGLLRAYPDVETIDYADFIPSVQSAMDIVHIHGLTWTNHNRNMLKEKLKDPNVSVRVVLLDVHGRFFDAYSEHISKNSAYLFEKTVDVLDIWKTIYLEATNNGLQKGARLSVLFHNGFPGKSIYRFDDTIISNPVTMIQPKTSKMPTYVCTKNNYEQKCLYYPYKSEIDWLVENASYSVVISEMPDLQRFDPRQFLLNANRK